MVAANINEIEPSATDLKTEDSLHVDESRVLQERTIGVFGAVSLVVNKIVGAGYVPMHPYISIVNMLNLVDQDLLYPCNDIQEQWQCRHDLDNLDNCRPDLYLWCADYARAGYKHAPIRWNEGVS